jgi:hypothetical protein
MARTPAHLRARRAVDACVPASPIGVELLRRYAEAVEFHGSDESQDQQLLIAYEVCKLVEETVFDGLSIEALQRTADVPAPSKTAAIRRRRAVHQLTRLLQAVGDLPDTRDLAASDRIQTELALTPSPGRGTLRRWLSQRQHRVGAYELSWEAAGLRKLEEVLCEHPRLDDRDVIGLWIRTLVRPIVDCGHHPVTRAIDPGLCAQCGATFATHGSRPSPGEHRQQKFRSRGAAYLRFRRLPTPTTQL